MTARGVIAPWFALAALAGVACGLSALVDAGYEKELAFTLNILWMFGVPIAIGVLAT